MTPVRPDPRCARPGPAVLLIAGAILFAGPAAAADRQIAEGGGPWCDRLDALQPFIEALLAGDKPAMAALPGCGWLEAGVAVEVVEDIGAFTEHTHVLRARLIGRRSGADGYTVSNVVEALHRPDGTGPRR